VIWTCIQHLSFWWSVAGLVFYTGMMISTLFSRPIPESERQKIDGGYRWR
jgi:hypothetical protein